MGGSSSTAITNWDGMTVPLNTMLNTSQTNHGEWYAEYRAEMKAWRELNKAYRDDWLDINYGYPDNTYQKGVAGSGGAYGDARRSEDLWRKVQLAIAGIQQVTAFYFANKAYKSAKEAQDHQIEVWETEKKWAKRYQDIWYNRYLPLEMKLLNLIKKRANDENHAKPNYDVAQSRAVVLVRSEYAKAREQVRRCVDPRCVGNKCDALKQLAFEEAKSAVGAVNKAYRFEEARADTKQAQLEESMFNLSKLGRGLQASSLGALDSASQASQIASTYKPYAGYENATAYSLGYWHKTSSEWSTLSGQNADRIDRQASGYLLTNGSQSNPSVMQAPSVPQITGTNAGMSSNSFVQGLNYSDTSVSQNSTGLYDNINIGGNGGGGFTNA